MPGGEAGPLAARSELNKSNELSAFNVLSGTQLPDQLSSGFCVQLPELSIIVAGIVLLIPMLL
jgi:hypothetical protein